MKARYPLGAAALLAALTLAPNAAAAGGEPVVITRVMQRDHIVTIKTDGTSPLYTVETKTGDLLVRDASPEELRRLQPEVYELVRTAIAGPPGGIIDASLTPN